jgi:hypothetical protein
VVFDAFGFGWEDRSLAVKRMSPEDPAEFVPSKRGSTRWRFFGFPAMSEIFAVVVVRIKIRMKCK